MQEINLVRKQKRNKAIIVFLLVVSIFTSGWLVGGLFRKNPTVDSRQFSKLNQLYQVLSDKWYYAGSSSDISEELINRAMVGMATVDYDPYTQYFSKEELASFEQAVDQIYSGIGVEMSTLTEYPLVINVFYDTPAYHGGIKIGDYLVGVDGVDTKGMTFEEVKEKVVGEIGTQVKISYLRGSETKEVALIRASISYTVLSKIIDKDIGYIEITTFGSLTANELQHALDEFKNDKIKKLVIDLRNNGGGYLDALIKMTSFFLEKDSIIFKQQYGNDEEVIYKAKGGNYDNFTSIIILTNQNTASASEVFSSALQENGKAKIVGTVTFGKGTSQTLYTFSDGSAIKYTQTHWLTAKSNQINGIGVKPDCEVNLLPFLEIPTPQLSAEYLIAYDGVDVEVITYFQKGLEMMGYKVDRFDGYFSKQTIKAMQDFEADQKITLTDSLDNEVFLRFVAACRQYYASNLSKLDTQLSKALELLG